MDLKTVQTFIQVAEQRNFTKAARELNYVQSTVTMQIQQLERELGFPLFDRIGKTVSLTALGEEFLGYAYEMMSIMHKAEALGETAGDMHGTLRVGVLESLLFSVVLDVLRAYKEKYPNLELHLKMGQATELLQQLKENRLDMAYLSAECNSDPDLCCCYRQEEQLIFVSDAAHPAAKKKRIPVSELLEYDFVVTERTGICYGRLRELAARCNRPLKASVEVDSTVAIIQLLQKGMGLAFLPEYAVRRLLEQGKLVKLDVELAPQTYYSQILCHKNRWRSPFMEGFIDAIRREKAEQGSAVEA